MQIHKSTTGQFQNKAFQLRSSPFELKEALDRLAGTSILVVGDVILDRYVWGNVDRISPEAPVPIVEVKHVEDRLGGAANVASNLRAIGVEVSLFGCIGEDNEGSQVLSLLDEEGIECSGVVVDQDRSTALKTRIIASRQQIVRIDREKKGLYGENVRKEVAASIDNYLSKVRGVIISDYGKGVVNSELIELFAMARANGKLSLTERPLVLDPHPNNYSIYRNIPVVKPNRKEAEAAVGFPITGPDSAKLASEVLLGLWTSELVIITLGEGGLMLSWSTEAEGAGSIMTDFIDTSARDVFDVSGAGDTVTAVFTAALASGCTPLVAGELANIAAGVVVSEVGTVSVSSEKIKSEIDRLADL